MPSGSPNPAGASTRTLLDDLFRARELVAVFSDRHSVEAMLRFEAALARAEAKMGIVPGGAAEVIAACCSADRIDFDALRTGAAPAGNLAIPLVKQLTAEVRAVDAEAAAFVHWGATSQDVQDTALVLQVAEALGWFDGTLEHVCAAMARLAETHRATPMAGRTWMQHAVPVTLGLKAAGWLDAMLRHRTRLSELTERACVLQFGGAAGTLASLGEQGLDVAEALAEELGLAVPLMPWHSHRDRLAEVAAWAGVLTGTLGKVARDLALGMQTEVAEFAEAAAAGRGGSSTMPQKRNPVSAASVLSAAVRVPGLVGTMLAAMVQENERGLGGWHAEWETLPELLMLAGGALRSLGETLEGLEVYPEVMLANLGRTRGLVMAEAVAMKLAPQIGRDKAHDLVAAASREAIARGCDLGAVLEENAMVMRCLSREELNGALDPARYLGVSDRMISSVLERYRGRKKAEG